MDKNKWIDFIIEFDYELDKNGYKDLFFYVRDCRKSKEFEQQFYVKDPETNRTDYDKVEYEIALVYILDDFMPKILKDGSSDVIPKNMTMKEFIDAFEDSGMEFIEMLVAPSVKISTLDDIKLSEMEYRVDLVFRVYTTWEIKEYS